LIHVWDSVSEMELRRGAPNLRDFLLQNLSAFSFEGYTKVGDNSRPNGVPLLTGQPFCGHDLLGRAFDDGCPTIFREYAAAGYRTSEAHDVPENWIFRFKDPPVDYYFRPLSRVAGEGIQKDGRRCWGPQLSLQTLLDYMKALAVTMGRDRRYVQLTWSSGYTHNFPLAEGGPGGGCVD